MIADYAVILSILVFVKFDMFFQLETPKLIVPQTFEVSLLFVYFEIRFFLKYTNANLSIHKKD